MLQRLSPGTGLACAAGVALTTSLFLPWYGGRARLDERGWEALATYGVVLAGIALPAIVLAVGQLAGARLPSSGKRGAGLALLGALAAILVLVVPLHTPGTGHGSGWQLALAAAASMIAGGIVEASWTRSIAPVGRWEHVPGWIRAGAAVALVVLAAAGVAVVGVGYALHCAGDDGVLEYPASAGASEVSFCRALDGQREETSATTRTLTASWEWTPPVLVAAGVGLLLAAAFLTAWRRRLLRGSLSAAALAFLIAVLPIVVL